MIETPHATATRIGRWITLVGLLTLLPLAAWLAQFGMWPVADKPEQWSFFGTYLSGLLSPLLAFVSFVGLLLTVREQRIAAALQAQATALQNRRAEGESLVTQIDACLQQAHDVLASTHWDWTNENARWHQTAELLLIANELKAQIDADFPALQARADGVFAHRRFLMSAHLNRADVLEQHGQAGAFEGFDGSSMAVDPRAVKVISDYVGEPATPRLQQLREPDLAEVGRFPDMLKGARSYYRARLKTLAQAPLGSAAVDGSQP